MSFQIRLAGYSNNKNDDCVVHFYFFTIVWIIHLYNFHFHPHQTASHTISKIAVSWNPSRVLTAPYRIQTYNLQSLIVDAASLDNDKKKNEEKWVDHGTIDVPEGFPQVYIGLGLRK